MAYAAVISLKQTIQRLLNSSHHLSILPPCRQILESLYKEAQSWPYILRKPDYIIRPRLNTLDGRIIETTCEFEDALEYHVWNQFQILQSDPVRPLSISLNLEELKDDIDSFFQTMKTLKEEYVKELSIPLSEENVCHVSLRIGCTDENKGKMVGLSDEVSRLRHLLTDLSCGAARLKCISLLGMAGIGKTTLADEIFNDPIIECHFDCRAFVIVGPKYRVKEILQTILAQLNPGVEIVMPIEGDERLSGMKRMMYECLKGKRYLIVFDDLWDGRAWGGLRRLFPDHKNGSRFLVTTRLERVAESVSTFLSANKMRFMNKNESWDLLRVKLFGGESCPSHLEKAGKKIAENCEGLPLTIVTVANLLSKVERTQEYWNEVAKKENSVFADAYNRMSKVLFLSFEYLPQHLKACFLYMGVFPHNYEIPISKLSMLWFAEGFFEPYQPDYIKFSGLVCLNELVSASLVMIPKQSSTSGIKTCRLHSVIWHLCNKEAEKSRFFQVVNSHLDGSIRGVENKRGLCIRENILLGIRDISNLSKTISSVHSLILCNNPPDHYQAVTMSFGHLKLLRVLDARTIHFYEFPIEVVKLVHLRYLALTFCSGSIPSSISKLWNLVFFIVTRHPFCTKSSESPSYLPIEIWDMQELKHLQIMGNDLLESCDGTLLQNHFTLSDVSAHSCTKGILERIPNLLKLGIRIELVPQADESLSFFNRISLLDKLESLKCVVMNPELRSKAAAPRLSSFFSSRLHKLSLSGFGFPWEDTRVIASLPCLRVLKLRCLAFRGPDWKNDEGFRWVEYFQIEDSDLVRWSVGREQQIFPCLMHLSLKNCYNLQEIPGAFAKSLTTIEVIDCNPLVVACAKRMEMEFDVLNVHSS